MLEKEKAGDVIDKQIYYPMVFVQDVITHCMGSYYEGIVC